MPRTMYHAKHPIVYAGEENDVRFSADLEPQIISLAIATYQVDKALVYTRLTPWL